MKKNVLKLTERFEKRHYADVKRVCLLLTQKQFSDRGFDRESLPLWHSGMEILYFLTIKSVLECRLTMNSCCWRSEAQRKTGKKGNMHFHFPKKTSILTIGILLFNGLSSQKEKGDSQEQVLRSSAAKVLLKTHLFTHCGILRRNITKLSHGRDDKGISGVSGFWKIKDKDS